jgi:hypothetical protein
VTWKRLDVDGGGDVDLLASGLTANEDATEDMFAFAGLEVPLSPIAVANRAENGCMLRNEGVVFCP